MGHPHGQNILWSFIMAGIQQQDVQNLGSLTSFPLCSRMPPSLHQNSGFPLHENVKSYNEVHKATEVGVKCRGNERRANFEMAREYPAC